MHDQQEIIFSFRPMNFADAHNISSWHYPDDYSIYDVDADPQLQSAIYDEKNWGTKLFSVFNGGDQLIGILSFEYDASKQYVELGLGLKPELVGQGMGQSFAEACVHLVQVFYPDTTIILHVACFNQRAIKVYERVGFGKTNIRERKINGKEYIFQEMILVKSD